MQAVYIYNALLYFGKVGDYSLEINLTNKIVFYAQNRKQQRWLREKKNLF